MGGACTVLQTVDEDDAEAPPTHRLYGGCVSAAAAAAAASTAGLVKGAFVTSLIRSDVTARRESSVHRSNPSQRPLNNRSRAERTSSNRAEEGRQRA